MNHDAVVMGAGLAGLLAAAALDDAGWQVTIVERDRLPDSPTHRRGVPQGPHLHSLLARGWTAIEDLCPGVIADLVDAGAHVLDDDRLGVRIHMQNGKYALNHTDRVSDPAALTTYLATRPLLEFHVRRRVATLPNVTVVDGHDIGELVVGQHDRITGVTVTDRHIGATRTLHADLVVDATGRATRTPLMLEALGYERPAQREFFVRGVYFSQTIAIPEQDSFAERLVLVVPATGGGRGGLVAGEHDTWTLTVAARADEFDSPPGTFADMLALAERFVPSHILPALRQAQPLTDVAQHRYPGGTWHRYDRCAWPPDGLFVVGDALCSLDPIHGQGITMAALHALALRTHVQAHGASHPERFYRSAADMIAPVWATNQPPGSTPARGVRAAAERRAFRWIQRKMLEAAGDIVVTERLVRIVNMVDPPQRLLEPSFLGHVLAHHLRRAVPALRKRPTVRTKAHA